MTSVLLVDEGIQLRWPAHACGDPDCGRHYDISQGYFDLANGHPTFEKREQQVRCPEDHESLEPPGIVTWRSAQRGCQERKTTQQ